MPRNFLLCLLTALAAVGSARASVPLDEEGFTRYVLAKYVAAMPEHEFEYVEPLHVFDHHPKPDTVGHDYLDALLAKVKKQTEPAEGIVDHYVGKTARLVAEIKEYHKAHPRKPVSIPNLGRGDQNLLIRLTEDLSSAEIVAYDGKKNWPKGWWLDVESFPRGSLKSIYPDPGDTNPGAPLEPCLPLGDGRGFVRRITFAPPVVSKAHVVIAQEEISDIVILNINESEIVPEALSEVEVNRRFSLLPKQRFLGKLDDMVFYWDPQRPDVVACREDRSNTTYEWKLKRVKEAMGVVRGKNKEYGLAVFQSFPFFSFPTNASGDHVLLEVSRNEAKVLPGRVDHH